MAKEKFIEILKEMARPSNASKGRAYDPEKPWLSILKDESGKPKNAKPSGYADGQIKKDLKRLDAEGKIPSKIKKEQDVQKYLSAGGRGRPTAASVKAKEAEGKKTGRNKLSQYSDKDSEQGKRKITLIATVKTEDGKTKEERKIIKDGETEKVKQYSKEFEKSLYAKYGYDSDVLEIDYVFGSFPASDSATNYERGDIEGGEHVVRASSKK